jgi:hypothetical protein
MSVNKLRKGENGNDNLSPYHWAPFVLNGFWMVPAYLFQKSAATSSDIPDLNRLPLNLKAKLEI